MITGLDVRIDILDGEESVVLRWFDSRSGSPRQVVIPTELFSRSTTVEGLRDSLLAPFSLTLTQSTKTRWVIKLFGDYHGNAPNDLRRQYFLKGYLTLLLVIVSAVLVGVGISMLLGYSVIHLPAAN